jgi:hypothetical protein
MRLPAETDKPPPSACFPFHQEFPFLLPLGSLFFNLRIQHVPVELVAFLARRSGKSPRAGIRL